MPTLQTKKAINNNSGAPDALTSPQGSGNLKMKTYYIVKLETECYFVGFDTYNFTTQINSDVKRMAISQKDAVTFESKEEAENILSFLMKNETNMERFPEAKVEEITFEEITFDDDDEDYLYDEPCEDLSDL